MDDYNLGMLVESKNEWCARLVNILVPPVIEGFNSIFQDAYKLCIENDEESKYLMTFQNLLNNISKWSDELIENEKQRILSETGCPYLEDLLTCVHIIQLKALSCARVGTENKKINVDIPNINIFLHKLYINAARKIYINIYLYEKDIQPLQIQKNNRELELIIKEALLDTIRSNIPVEVILRSYLDETQESDVTVTEREEVVVDKEAIQKQKQKEERDKEIERIREEVRQEFILKNNTKVENSIETLNNKLNAEREKESVIDFKNNVNFDNLEIDIQKSNNNIDQQQEIKLDIEDLSNDNKDKDEFNNDIIDLDIEEL